MNAQDRLARLRFEDPVAAAAVVDALWAQLAREEPRMFAALWRRANRPSRRPASVEPAIPVPVQWVEEPIPAVAVEPLPALAVEPRVEVIAQRLPTVDLTPTPPYRLMIEPSPSLAELLPADEHTSA
jgi:hypothetical protein